MVHPYSEYYSAIKKNELLIYINIEEIQNGSIRKFKLIYSDRKQIGGGMNFKRV